jgi:hypothetical protein
MHGGAAVEGSSQVLEHPAVGEDLEALPVNYSGDVFNRCPGRNADLLVAHRCADAIIIL